MDNRSKDLQTTVDHLVTKRQHTLQHISRALSEQGCFWLNTVRVSELDVKEYIS
jgi:hypothetical protein